MDISAANGQQLLLCKSSQATSRLIELSRGVKLQNVVMTTQKKSYHDWADISLLATSHF